MKSSSSSALDFDSLLPHVGEMGPYQIGYIALMSVPIFPAAFIVFGQVFFSAAPDHWCAVGALAGLEGDPRPLSAPRTADGAGFAKCAQFDVNWTSVFEANGGEWPDAADPSWPTAACKEGWTYDKSDYESTLVTEVLFLLRSMTLAPTSPC